MPAADLAFFQGGASSTSRVAASRFFLLFWTPVSDVFLASMHISHIHEPRSGEPIFFAILNPRIKVMFSWHLCTYHISTSRVAASRFFLRILNPRKWCFPGNWNVRLNQKLYHECFRPYNAVILGLEKLGNTASPGAWIHKRLVFFRLDVSLNVICAAMSNRKIRTT